MIRNYVKIAWRTILRYKFHSLITISGLTAGTVCFLYIILYVNGQLGYDVHHQDADQLYRVCTLIKGGNGSDNFNSATASPPIAFGLKNDFPEVEEACRIVSIPGATDHLIRSENNTQGIFADRGWLADSTIFDLFSFHFLDGSAERALEGPNTIVLSSNMASKLFGNKSAINQNVITGAGEDEQILKVTGVFDEHYAKSHLNPNYIISMHTPGFGEFVRNNNQWAGQNFVASYIRLSPHTDPASLENKLPGFLQDHGKENLEELGMEKTLYLQKVKDIHLYSRGIDNQIGQTSDIRYLILLLALALFIQLIACVNFVNLSTAQAGKRRREIGIRKVIGANKNALVGQFLGESVLIAFTAILIAIPVCRLLLPVFNQITEGHITGQDMFLPQIILAILTLGILTGLTAGIYPAFYMARIKPIFALGHFGAGMNNPEIFRKALVIFQFAIAIILITGIGVIKSQIQYLYDKELGFDQKERIALSLDTEKTQSKYPVINAQLLTLPEVLRTGGCEFYPSKDIKYDVRIRLPEQESGEQMTTKVNYVTEAFFETMDIPILAGRNFLPTDSNQVIVNQTLLKELHIEPSKAIGTRLLNAYEGTTSEYTIVGVHKDYHFNSLKAPIVPLMNLYSSTPQTLVCKVTGDSYGHIVSKIENLWNKMFPDVPLQYEFIDENVHKLYKEERRLIRLSGLFTFLAILISCMGLFGLATFTTQQRTKEIGIRKVLGASVSSVVTLLSKDFIRLVLIAIVIASPIAWYAMNRWLQGFAYRIELQWWMFAGAGLVAVVIAMVTVSGQAVRAAMADPTKSLKSE